MVDSTLAATRAIFSPYNFREINIMAKGPLYHTDSKEYPEAVRECHHDHKDCYEGKKIKPEHRRDGDGHKRLCKVCEKLA
jgi:hypothetical protein